MAKTLREIGFDVVDGTDLTRLAMEQKIRAFADKLDAANVALFFYAGHGLQVGGKNYLIPVDAKLTRPGDLSLDTIDVSVVMAQMEARERVNLIFLDACRDNPLARSFASTLGASRSAAVGQGLASIQSAVGTMIAFATQPDAVALDGQGRNSPFTAALLKHIRTPGTDISVMMREVRNDVLAATGRRQVPWDHSSLTAAVVLVPGSGQQAVAALPAPPPLATTARPGAPVPAAPQPSAAEAAQAWAVTKDTTSVAVLQTFTRRYGTTIYGEMARARLKELQAAVPKPQDKVAAAGPAVAAVPATPPAMPSLTGKWQMKSDGGFTYDVTLVQQGNQFTGEKRSTSALSSTYLSPIVISGGKIDGDRVIFFEGARQFTMALSRTPANKLRMEGNRVGTSEKAEMTKVD
jgi:uncharacterized caspase-like protein